MPFTKMSPREFIASMTPVQQAAWDILGEVDHGIYERLLAGDLSVVGDPEDDPIPAPLSPRVYSIEHMLDVEAIGWDAAAERWVVKPLGTGWEDMPQWVEDPRGRLEATARYHESEAAWTRAKLARMPGGRDP